MGRNSNIEFLRIIAMLAIVAGHVVEPFTCGTTSSSQFVAFLMGSGLRIAVNVFLLVGVWFMVDYEFRFDRILRMYLASLLYSTCSLAVTFATSGNMPLIDLLRSIEPFFGVQYWFITVYIMLLLLAPVLQRFFRLPRKLQAAILLPIGIYCCLFASYPYPGKTGSMERFLGWFIYVFLLIGFLKRSRRPILTRRLARIGLLVSIALYLALVLARCWDKTSLLAYQHTYDMVSLTNFLCAFGVFWFAVSRKRHENRLVNLLARQTLGIYLLQGTFIRIFVKAPLPLSATPLAVVGIYAVCWIIDFARQQYLEPLYRNSHWHAAICQRVDGAYAHLLSEQPE